MTQDQIESFADCGEAMMPIEEACLIADCTENEFLDSEEAQKAYRTGQLKTKLKIRQSVIKMAKDGVPSMVKIFLERYDSETIGEVVDVDEEAEE